MTGRSVSDGNTARAFAVCARLAAIIADSATTEPDERSMPPVRITCVTPIASNPTIETCSTMTSRRCPLNRKLAPRTPQPIVSNRTAMPIEHQQHPGVGRESPFRQCAASLMRSSGFASARSRMPATRPCRITITRSLMPRISGISDEIMMTAAPPAASVEISR